MTGIIEETEELGLLVAYNRFLSDSRSALLDYKQFRDMLADFNAQPSDTDFWNYQKQWFRGYLNRPQETTKEWHDRRTEHFGTRSHLMLADAPTPDDIQANVALIVAQTKRRAS